MTCSNNHEVADGSKFCGDCGDKVPEATATTMAKCTACSIEQPTDHRFCGGCGESMPTAESDLDGLMADLAQPLLAKSMSAGTADALPIAPADDALLAETGDDVATLAAASDQPDLIMAKSLVDRLNLLGRQNQAILAATQTAGAPTVERLGIMSKALAAVIGRVRALGQPEPAPEAPRGPRSAVAGARSVTVLHKANTGAAAPDAAGPRGNALMAKALTAKSAGRLTGSEITRLNYFTNRNASLDDVASVDEGLAERVAAAIAA